MTRVAIFGGTTEGRRLGAFLAGNGIRVDMFVATAYGEELVEPMEGLTVTARRMDATEMAVRLRVMSCDCVVDATHPYAREVTANIRAACRETGIRYLRLVREEGGASGDGVIEAADTVEAAKLLAQIPGRVLLTLGSKELAAFTGLADWRDRIVARVLPSPQVVAGCFDLGYTGKNLICMQGPFTHGMNVATLEQVGAKIMVTKDSGREGGFHEKLSAAREAGAKVIVVRRPEANEEGHTLAQLEALLAGKQSPLSPAVEAAAGGEPRFPLFVELAGKPVLVVGGGEIAARRVRALLEFGAKVTLVSPNVTPVLRELSDTGAIEWRQAAYDNEAAGFFLVVAATDDRAVNRRVGIIARALQIPVSVADRREECTFWFPAVVRKSNIVAGITSTDGDHGAVRKIAGIIRDIVGETQ